MSRKDELVARLRQMAGTPSELAAAVGVEKDDATFRRAVRDLVDEGVLVAEGSTSDRRYSNPSVRDLDAELLALVPCSAQEFSAGGHRLGLGGHELFARKVGLGIETFKDEDGRWFCRHRPGYEVEARRVASGFGAAVDLGIAGGPRVMVSDDVAGESPLGVARTVAFARMSARLGHGTIGARVKE